MKDISLSQASRLEQSVREHLEHLRGQLYRVVVSVNSFDPDPVDIVTKAENEFVSIYARYDRLSRVYASFCGLISQTQSRAQVDVSNALVQELGSHLSILRSVINQAGRGNTRWSDARIASYAASPQSKPVPFLTNDVVKKLQDRQHELNQLLTSAQDQLERSEMITQLTLTDDVVQVLTEEHLL